MRASSISGRTSTCSSKRERLALLELQIVDVRLRRDVELLALHDFLERFLHERLDDLLPDRVLEALLDHRRRRLARAEARAGARSSRSAAPPGPRRRARSRRGTRTSISRSRPSVFFGVISMFMVEKASGGVPPEGRRRKPRDERYGSRRSHTVPIACSQSLPLRSATAPRLASTPIFDAIRLMRLTRCRCRASPRSSSIRSRIPWARRCRRRAAACRFPRRRTSAFNPLGVPCERLHARARKRGRRRGSRSGRRVVHRRRQSRYTTADFKVRYYPGEVVLRGFAVGAERGRHSILARGQRRISDARRRCRAPTARHSRRLQLAARDEANDFSSAPASARSAFSRRRANASGPDVDHATVTARLILGFAF